MGTSAATENERSKTMKERKKEGVYWEQKETVEMVRKTFPYFRIEDGRDDIVRAGNEFAHPSVENAMSGDLLTLQEANISPFARQEDLKAARDSFTAMGKSLYDENNKNHPEFDEYGWWEEYDVDGCAEELDAPKVHILVRRLRESYKKGPYPVILMSPTGGLIMNGPYMTVNAPITKYFGCQLIAVQHRTYADAPYPAMLNDMHAAYQWMVDNAEMLNIDTDKILLAGASSGGGIVSALAFRLKRYGWCGAPKPRGVFAYDALLDDFETTPSMRMIDRTWSGIVNRGANMHYMGTNFASGFLGPEAFANHATVEECRGLPPFAIYEHQDCPGCGPAIQFVKKLNEAGVYCSLQVSGGATHVGEDQAEGRTAPFMPRGEDYDPKPDFDAVGRAAAFYAGEIQDFIEYDLRR